eukprot:TRINITY_DN14299_c0_g1_i3.p2 TRINITY_DN14299_c0_g1~~TRINITY_DN14299_c0_g1_i3.p2  ORF type:complete len:201 (+),score=15.22 TRINITY_DN14299_c0_g1_i3:93-695(+)
MTVEQGFMPSGNCKSTLFAFLLKIVLTILSSSKSYFSFISKKCFLLHDNYLNNRIYLYIILLINRINPRFLMYNIAIHNIQYNIVQCIRIIFKYSFFCHYIMVNISPIRKTYEEKLRALDLDKGEEMKTLDQKYAHLRQVADQGFYSQAAVSILESVKSDYEILQGRSKLASLGIDDETLDAAMKIHDVLKGVKKKRQYA